MTNSGSHRRVWSGLQDHQPKVCLAAGGGFSHRCGRSARNLLEPGIVQEIEGIVAERDVDRKLRAAMQLTSRTGQIGRGSAASHGDPLPGPNISRSVRPGRPEPWDVRAAGELSDRPRLGSPRGRYLLMHSVAHIELSAVELALLAVGDFPEESADYHRAMLGIAREEVIHTRMLLRRLEELGGGLGSDPVHLALFDTASRYDELPARLAVVPRILEARGLDVSARLRDGLHRAGDDESGRILDRIYHDEIGHVQVGTLWYRAACAERGLDDEKHFLDLFERFRPRRGGGGLIDRVGRRQAGFSERELDAIDPPTGR